MTAQPGCEIWKMELPLPRVIGTPGGSFDRVHAVALRLRDGDGNEGAAYASMQDAPGMHRVADIMAGLIAERGADPDALIEIERNAAEASASHAGRSALSAISLAAWDMLGRRRGVPCAALWDSAPRVALGAYASFFFNDLSPEALVEEARHYRAQGFRMAKMRAGLPGTQDEARYAAMCEVFDAPRAVAVEAFFTFTGDRVARFMQGCDAPPMWIEDPMRYGAIGQVAHKDLIGAGESCTTLTELLALRRSGIDRLILDVQYLGGPLRFLEAARTLRAMGAEIGSHVFTHESLHLLAALPASLPVEVFDWWQPIFREAPSPDADGRLQVRGPGFGRTLDEDNLRRFGEMVVL